MGVFVGAKYVDDAVLMNQWRTFLRWRKECEKFLLGRSRALAARAMVKPTTALSPSGSVEVKRRLIWSIHEDRNLAGNFCILKAYDNVSTAHYLRSRRKLVIVQTRIA